MSVIQLNFQADTVPLGDTFYFGENDTDATPGMAIDAADGTYGEFTVSSGVIAPKAGQSSLTVGNTSVDGKTVTVIADAKSFNDLSDAQTWWRANKAIAATVLMQPGIYSITDATGIFAFQSRASEGVRGVFTAANRKNMPIILMDGTPSTNQQSAYITIEWIKFYRADGSSAPLLADATFQVNDWIVQDCIFYGDDLTAAQLSDTSYPSGGFGKPAGLYLLQSGAIVRRNTFKNLYYATYTKVDGEYRFQDNYAEYCYLDFYRFDCPDNRGDETALKIISGNTVAQPFGRADEAGGATPHPDGFQFINSGSATNPGVSKLLFIYNRTVYGGVPRADSAQACFMKTDAHNVIFAGNVMMTFAEAAGIYIGEDGSPEAIWILNNTVGEQSFGGTQAMVRINNLAGEVRCRNNLTSDALDQVSWQSSGYLDQSNDDETLLANSYDVLNGPGDPTSPLAAMVSYSPVASGSADTNGRGALTTDYEFRDLSLPPFRPDAPSATGGAGSFSVTHPSAPYSHTDSVTAWDMRYSSDGGANWTEVIGHTSASSTSVAAGDYITQVRAKTAVSGRESCWSESSSQVTVT